MFFVQLTGNDSSQRGKGRKLKDFKGRDWTESNLLGILLDHRKDKEILQDIDQKLKASVNLTGIQNNNDIQDAKPLPENQDVLKARIKELEICITKVLRDVKTFLDALLTDGLGLIALLALKLMKIFHFNTTEVEN